MYTIEQFDQEKTKILKYILYKKRTEQEIRQKFTHTIDSNMLEDIIEDLKEKNYINDTEFMDKQVKDFINLKNLSIKELQYKLIAKGLNKNKVEDYIEENREDLQEYEIKSAEKIFCKKLMTMDQQEIKQYLLKKGYQLDHINRAIEKLESL